MPDTDLLILGAGASGLLCALHAARLGRRVVVLDHGREPGAKVRIAGGGRANVTNTAVGPENYLSENPHFCASALARFGTAEAVDLVRSCGLTLEEREAGRLFLREPGAELVAALFRACTSLGVSFLLDREVKSACREGAGFRVETSAGPARAGRLAVALGGPAWAACGATDAGYALAKDFGLAVVAPRPGLVPLSMPRGWEFAALTGISLPVRIGCGRAAFSDQLLFTHRGLSGPAALQISSYWRPGQEISVDLLPGRDLEAELAAVTRSGLKVKNFLAGLLPARLPALLLGPEACELPVAGLGAARRREVAARVHAWRLTPAGTLGLARAEVTLGGVDTRAVSSRTMEASGVPGLFFCGEVLDVAGWLGGYNLHWAFASGAAAGSAP